MAFTNQISKIRMYDNIPGRVDPVSITWSTQEVGTGTDAGRFGQLETISAVPGTLDTADPAVYTRTNTSSFPVQIRHILTACWDDALHTAYEAYLRG